MPSSKTEYPGTNQMSSVELALGFLPESLRVLLELLLTGQDISKKVASIGHAIVQAIHPRVIIMPLQLGLAVEMHHHFASRYLIDTLNEHGFCSPYHEVQRFERNAAVTSGTDVPNYTDSDYIQYIADNVDHNVRTIDGYNTFHGMGMLGVITPAKQSTRTIPRVTVTNEDILAVGRVNIHHMSVPCTTSESQISKAEYWRVPWQRLWCTGQPVEHIAPSPLAPSSMVWNDAGSA